MKKSILFMLPVLLALTAHAQDNRLYPLVKATTKVAVPGTIVNAPKCDGKGNVYLRAQDEETSKANRGTSQTPIYKIAPNGAVVTSFKVFDLSPDLSAVPFFVTGDGKVYMGAWDPDYGVYVVSFSPGSPGQKVRLDSDYFLPYQIAVFKTGEILLSGVAGPRIQGVYTGLFDATGKLLKKIYEPEDEDARLRRDAGEYDFVPEGTPDTGNYFAMRGDAALGSDGNVYLLRSTGLIYVISHTGEVVRKMRVPPPEPGMVAHALRATQDRLAVVFVYRRRTIGRIQVVDYNGEMTATHADPTTSAALLACYASQGDSEGFAFAGFQDGQIAITRFRQK